MNEFEYCYWLMGIFELGNPKQFNSKQLELVKEHLNLVKYREHTFCNWLQGVLDANEQDFLSEKKTQTVLEKLRSEFVNIIDRSYPKYLWDALYAAHEGKEVESPKQIPEEKPRVEALC